MFFGFIGMSIDSNHDGFNNVILLSQDSYAIGGVEGGVPFNVLLLLLFLLIETILGPQFFLLLLSQVEKRHYTHLNCAFLTLSLTFVFRMACLKWSCQSTRTNYKQFIFTFCSKLPTSTKKI